MFDAENPSASVTTTFVSHESCAVAKPVRFGVVGSVHSRVTSDGQVICSGGGANANTCGSKAFRPGMYASSALK